MASRYDREYDRNYGRASEEDYERGPYGRPFQYGSTGRRFPQPEFPDRYSPYDYAPAEDTFTTGRDNERGYRYGRERYGTDYGYERDLRGDYGYGRDGVVNRTANRYDRGRYPGRYQESDAHERGWWDRTKDELASWFGDEEAERRRRLDELRAGPYRGRGPRGYRRSDERIKEDVHDRLTDHPYLDAYEVVVLVADGDVTLSGTVGSRYEKRLAEDLAGTVSGVHNVQNNIRAVQATPTTSANAEVNDTAIRTASAAGGKK